jgi:hypothetical protein
MVSSVQSGQSKYTAPAVILPAPVSDTWNAAATVTLVFAAAIAATTAAFAGGAFNQHSESQQQQA